jgi:methionine-rich copper-binding protein CopC
VGPAGAVRAGGTVAAREVIVTRVVHAVGLWLMLLSIPLTAWGHAELLKSVPARRAVLSRPPARVQLWFNERLEPAFSGLSVWDRTGAQVDLKDVQIGSDDAKRLSVSLPPLEPGVYVVKFRVLSVDGHVVESEFSFTIRRQ